MTSFFAGSPKTLFLMRVSLLTSGSARVMMMLVLMVRGRIIMGMLLPTVIPL
jgi:hypothetical protein